MSRARWILLAVTVALGLWMALELRRHRVDEPYLNPNAPPPADAG